MDEFWEDWNINHNLDKKEKEAGVFDNNFERAPGSQKVWKSSGKVIYISNCKIGNLIL